MACGKLSKCCCFPLATGAITAAVLFSIECILYAFAEVNGFNPFFIVLNLLIAVIIILSVWLKNRILSLIIVFLNCLSVIFNSIFFVLVFVALFVVKEKRVIIPMIIALFVFGINIAITSYFINIFYSLSKVYEVGGSGWEFKNCDEIQNEKNTVQNTQNADNVEHMENIGNV